MLPWLLGLVCITAIPVVASLYLFFMQYRTMDTPQWAGLANYERILGDARFWSAVRVTVTHVFVSVPLQIGFALFLALVLDNGPKGLAFYRSAYYLPSLLGSSVAIAVLWRQIFGHSGLVNQVLSLVDIEGTNSLQSPGSAPSTLIVLNVRTFGSPTVIFLAGLRQIPEKLYEAARVDGAGWLRQFGIVTVPMLTLIIFFNLILQTIGSFQAFTQAHIVSVGTGGPVGSTLFYTRYVYQQTFVNFDMGNALALAWVLLVAIALMAACHFTLSKHYVFYGD